MNATRTILSILLVSTPLAAGCRPGGGQAMPMAAKAPAAQPSEPDLRDPSDRDPALHTTTGTGATMSNATMPPPEQDTDEMAAQMKALGAQMKDMGAKMQHRAHAMKTAKGQPPAGAAMAGTEPDKIKVMAARMKDMGAKMQHKGHAMKTAKGQPPAGAAAMGAMDPDKMMKMGSEMMGMAGPMMEMGEMGAMDPDEMMKMGSEMMGMAGPMMEMCCMDAGMGKKKNAPMKKPMGTPPPTEATPSDPPMPHM